MWQRILFMMMVLASTLTAKAAPGMPELTPTSAKTKLDEIMQSHVTQQKFTAEVAKHMLVNYLDLVDPAKVYLLESEVTPWAKPSDALLETVVREYQTAELGEFRRIYQLMADKIARRGQLEVEVEAMDLPTDVSPREFENLTWCATVDELKTRLLRLRALRQKVAVNLDPEQRNVALQRVAKRRTAFEADFIQKDPVEQNRIILVNYLKAGASALDSQTAYFTPGEAEQFMINVQQRLFGIGAQLRDDLTGFSVIKIIEGGPAARGGKLKENDRIIAVNSEPVVGMEITEAVQLIRGEAGTTVNLTVLRTVDKTNEQRYEIPVTRGEVILEESRIEASYEPFGDGVLGYIKLYSFYEDPQFSSASDLEKEIVKLKKEHNLKGLVLDLRYNSGGLLSQAVSVTGLFISKGVVVSVKDNSGQLQRLRDTNSNTAWDGPLVVLTNRLSASAAEIVTQTLKDYGRPIIVGDDRTFGKGTFQTFTLGTTGHVHPDGEYKVTRGRYYTVSGTSPQLDGVIPDIVVPGALSEAEIGERFSKFPVSADRIDASFDDDLADVPQGQRSRIAELYHFNLQPKITTYTDYLDLLRQNSATRIAQNRDYQGFLKLLKSQKAGDENQEMVNEEETPNFTRADYQKTEAYNILKDLIFFMTTQPKSQHIVKDAA